MAHIFGTSRGPRYLREQWMGFMQAQMWPLKRKNLQTGQEEMLFVQGMLRPIELWEYIVPEECLDEVINNLTDVNEDGSISHGDWNSKKGKFMMKGLRVALGAQKLPKIKEMPATRIPKDAFKHFGMSIIGWKKDNIKDYHWKDGSSYNQEGL